MTSKLTIEQARRLRNDFECWQQDYDPKNDKEQYDMFSRGMAAMDMLIAGMYQEPVAYAVSNDFWNQGNHKQHIDGKQCDLFFPGDVSHGEKFEPDDYDYVFPLYRHAQPAPERDQVRSEHAEWSQATFGNVGPVGPLKHLSKEALEAAAEPDDLSEWADMQFLLWDAQRRAGITDEQITKAMIEKLAVNKLRDWPEPKDGEPRLHIKEQPAPVVPCPFPCGWDNLNKLAIQDAAFIACGLVEGEPITEAHRQAAISNNDRLLKVISACRTAMLQPGNSPVIPEGYVMVPKGMTPEMMRAVQIKSELGGYASSELSGAYDMFSEFWDVAISSAPQQEVK